MTLSANDIFFLEKEKGTYVVLFSALPFLGTLSGYCLDLETENIDVVESLVAFKDFNFKKLILKNKPSVANFDLSSNTYNTFHINQGFITSAYNTYSSEVSGMSATLNTLFTAASVNTLQIFTDSGSALFFNVPGVGIVETLSITGNKKLPAAIANKIYGGDIQVKLLWNENVEFHNYKSQLSSCCGSTSDFLVQSIPYVHVSYSGPTTINSENNNYSDGNIVSFDVKQFCLSAEAKMYWRVIKAYYDI